jgi:hypothetical protein
VSIREARENNYEGEFQSFPLDAGDSTTQKQAKLSQTSQNKETTDYDPF